MTILVHIELSKNATSLRYQDQDQDQDIHEIEVSHAQKALGSIEVEVIWYLCPEDAVKHRVGALSHLDGFLLLTHCSVNMGSLEIL